MPHAAGGDVSNGVQAGRAAIATDGFFSSQARCLLGCEQEEASR